MSTSYERNRLGNNIRALREAYEETQEDLAKVIPCMRETIGKYERGERHIDDEIKQKIAKHYKVSVQELLFSDLSKYNLHFNKEILYKYNYKEAFYSL